MLKLRLKRNGRKKQPSYRIIVIDSRAKRSGRPVDEVGFYNPFTKLIYIDKQKAIKWLEVGVKPSDVVLFLLKKSETIV